MFRGDNMKAQKIIIRALLSIVIIFGLMIIGLAIYSSGSYIHLSDMDTAIESLNLDQVTITENSQSIQYIVDNPKMNVIFIPGGLVEPESYKYLASSIALNGYNVTIVKVVFNLAILTPKSSLKYINPDLVNVLIGHSLGGVVASMAASGKESVSKVIMLGSYPIKDLSDKDTLLITAEHDEGMDIDKFNDSLQYLNEQNVIFNIEGGNHAQFGWYGPQKGDGTADITTLSQQNIVANQILSFLNG